MLHFCGDFIQVVTSEGVPAKIWHVFLTCPVLLACPSDLNLLDLNTVTLLGEG